MPPKRKAPDDSGTATDPSPPKRHTRRTLAAQRVTRIPDVPKNSPTKRATRQVKEPLPENIAEKPAQNITRTRRRKGIFESPDSTPSPKNQHTATRTLSKKESLKENALNSSDEPDELNITTYKPPVPPSTPGARPAASRMVMDCIVISTTPKALAAFRPHNALGASASANGPASLMAKAAPIHKAPATPSRQARIGSVSPPTIAQVLPFPSTSPRRRPPTTPQVSPSRRQHPVQEIPVTPHKNAWRSSPRTGDRIVLQHPVNLPKALPPHLAPCLRSQKRSILGALHSHSVLSEDSSDEGEPSTNATAYTQLQDLLTGTVIRGEGNSCLLLGPRGSGKTTLIERVIKALPENPIVLRLSGYAQHNDRLALREIARQLSQQTGETFLNDRGDVDNADDQIDPFVDPVPSVALPPPSHLPALVSVLPTLSRPTVVILDAFDLFAQHARQSLLYCLFDTVQSCRTGQGNNGLAVIGVTARIDTINLLEKRVKSRFSRRMIRTASPFDLHRWMDLSRHILCTPIDFSDEWGPLWNLAVHKFLEDRKVTDMMKDTFALTRDVRMLKQVLTSIVVNLQTASPFPTSSHLFSAISAQRIRRQFPNLHTLSYPSVCLLIAAMHAHTAGHDVITFEMLYDAFREQFRASSAAPIRIEGGSIGMAKCTREVLMSGFEQLWAARMFTPVAAPSSSIAPEFVRYRCLVAREDVKQAVDMMGQTNLKKWLHKAS
ncbi:hypothetical protein PAXRUDRAFT_824314 [Paxillus rubicundulus Ve08.2h10]|uniref:Origin recognition complex subunit 4 n=1 Tax=Paxillus rubicundulus Ve08.2h10 TaxID=930991 RepID=A0A0D0DIA8_9AGAM|nr:hypothetical protein PAXRUDRAFT_824314 [Paxillus rubicundulus Ve08.2h10]